MHIIRHLSRTASLLLATSATLFLTSAPASAATPIAVGVNIANAPDQMAPMQSYASTVGRKPAIVMWYQQWSEPLSWSTQLPNTQAMGAIPMITWDPIYNGVGIPLTDIAKGKYDSYIKASAAAAAAWKKPILIRFGHEMNLGGSPFGPGHSGDTPAAFVAAWRHVVTVFREMGATNVEWVWSPNVNCGGKCPFQAYFPGGSFVDWVALDGYNYSSVDRIPWYSFSQIFASSYAEMRALTSKPMMIGETASTELGGNKAQWITQTFANMASQYPAIRAVIWFERDKETDWRVESSPASLAAFKAIVSAPEFGGTAATLMGVAPLAKDADSTGAGTVPIAAPTSSAGSLTAASHTSSSAKRHHKKPHHTNRKPRKHHEHHRGGRHSGHRVTMAGITAAVI